MSEINAKYKWNKIYSKQVINNIKPIPAEVLIDHSCLLPETGAALDLASGLGGNAIFLAERGLSTYAWDISQQASNLLQIYCEENNVPICIETRDIEKQPPSANSFDVICVRNYLERTLSQPIIASLRPNGLLFYQTFTTEKVSDEGPSNPNYRLRPNELLEMFSFLKVLVYQEYGCVGNHKMGLRNIAQLVAQKR